MREEIQEFVECKESLDLAIVEAGGVPLGMSTLKEMNALDLIDLISTNMIRFNFTGKKVK